MFSLSFKLYLTIVTAYRKAVKLNYTIYSYYSYIIIIPGGNDLNSLIRDNPEMLGEMFSMSKHHVTCSAKLVKNLKAGEKPLCNIALYHLAVWFKIMMRFICLRFEIEYADDDAVEAMFDKTRQYLPARILGMEIEICYWYNFGQYESANLKTADEACAIGRIIEAYFNDEIHPYVLETDNSIKNSTLFSVDIKALDKF